MKKPIRDDDSVSGKEESESELRALENLEDAEEFLSKNPEFTKRLKGLFKNVEDKRA